MFTLKLQGEAIYTKISEYYWSKKSSLPFLGTFYKIQFFRQYKGEQIRLSIFSYLFDCCKIVGLQV